MRRNARPGATFTRTGWPFVLVAALVAAPGCSNAANDDSASFPFSDDDTTPTRPPSTTVAPLFIGSGGFAFGFGSAYPGACAPQGLVKVGPDTTGRWGRINFLHYSGYWYGDDTIRGFSHLHLHGTGAQDYGVVGLMPIATDAFDPAKRTAEDYASLFEKRTEEASPGRYAVTLAGNGIRAEMTATTHAAHHRDTYPAGAKGASLLLDLDHRLSGSIEGVAVSVDGASRTIEGKLLSKGGMSSGFGGIPVHFALRTRAPWTRARLWHDAEAPALAASGTANVTGTKVGLVLDFDLEANPGPLEVQVGISLVSVANARANLEAEMQDFDFDRTAAATVRAWEPITQAIVFEGAGPEAEAMREAALVHAFLMPTIVSDANGEYRSFAGGTTKRASTPVVSDLSLWDTYRTLHPLYALIAPERAASAVTSLLAMHDDLGFFPKWPIGTGESGVMIGSSADTVIADAYLRGVRGFDAAKAYEALRELALGEAAPPPRRGGREFTRFLTSPGFVPASVGRSVSWTIEYGQSEFALGNFAEALGLGSDVATFRTRMRGWQNLLDPRDGFLWSKNADGTWATSHGDPAVITDEYAEANPWQSVWGPYYDAEALISSLGGRAAFVAKLREFFVKGKEEQDAVNWRNELSAGGRRDHFWPGNEPDIHAAYLFALAGRPDLTQKWVRWVDAQAFTAGADGLPGNDDGGTMSAWLLFDWLGFYPIAGSDLFVIGAPRFPRARVRVPGGEFVVEAAGVSPSALYVQSVTLDGAPVTKPLLRQRDLRAGSTLRFTMGERPSRWGR